MAKALAITTDGEIVQTAHLVESSEATILVTGDGIPRADAEGLIAAGWIPPLAIGQLPVAESGEVSASKVVRADDSRLGNPPVGGDLSGSAAAATVIKLQGRAFSSAAPTDGDGVVWNQAANRWEPGTVGGDAGNATQLQGRDVSSTAPSSGDALVWNGSAWAPAEIEGGAASPGALIYLHTTYR